MGGGESQAVLLARLLLEHGRYGVHMACLHRRGVLLEEASRLGLGEIPEFPLTSFYDRNMLVQLRRFAKFAREREIHVAHSQDFYMNIFGILGAALARVPVRIAFRGETGGWRTPAQNLAERFAFRFAHAVHANSEAVKRHLIENGVPASKIVTVYNGLDLSRVTTPPDVRRDEALAMFGLASERDRRFVTIVANMRHEVKNHEMFLRAARRVREAVPDAAFILAGEGELTEKLRSFARELGVGHDTFFIGRCEKIAALLLISDVCVLSSRAEGFSNSILEYMAAARPVVVTDVGGAREAVVEGETGYLVQSDDDETMAARIVSLLTDSHRAREMGMRARLRVEEKFSDAAQLENTEALYESLLARARPEAEEVLKDIGREGA
jgi:glycosyltransferase involved in cell wall biosynthesis